MNPATLPWEQRVARRWPRWLLGIALLSLGLPLLRAWLARAGLAPASEPDLLRWEFMGWGLGFAGVSLLAVLMAAAGLVRRMKGPAPPQADPYRMAPHKPGDPP